MPKWISVLFSHCIKWTRVLVPLPLQRPRGMLCWWKHRLCVCAEGWAFPERIRVRSSSQTCMRWYSSWTLDQSECVWGRHGHRAEPCQTLSTIWSSAAASTALPGCQSSQGRQRGSSGLQGEWAQPRQGWGRLSDCTIFSYRACWDPGVVGEGLLWLNAAWMYTCAIFFNLPVFCTCWSTSLLLLTLN